MSGRLALYLLLALCGLFGAVIYLELVPSEADDAPAIEAAQRPAAVPAAPQTHGESQSELVAKTLARPLFSPTRRPPEAAPTDSGKTAELSDTRLTGIVTEPDRRVAIFDVTGAKPLRLTEGESVSGWRIDSITPQEVSLSGPSGTTTLQPKADPNIVRVAAPVPVPNALAQPPQPAAAAQPRPGGVPSQVRPPVLRSVPPPGQGPPNNPIFGPGSRGRTR
jgi:hypothetical protein